MKDIVNKLQIYCEHVYGYDFQVQNYIIIWELKCPSWPYIVYTYVYYISNAIFCTYWDGKWNRHAKMLIRWSYY